MEPIDYGGALARGWRLLAVVGILGLVAGLLVSHGSSTAAKWTTTSHVGITPTASAAAPSSSLLSVTPQLVAFAAQAENVLTLAAKQAGLDEPYSSLRASVSVVAGSSQTSSSSSSGPPPGVVFITVEQGSAEQSAALNNAIDLVLATSLAGEAQQAQKTAVSQVQAAIARVEAEAKSVSATNPTLAGALLGQVGTLAAKEAALIAEPTDTGFVVLQGANASLATKSGGTSLTSSRPVRAAGGLVVGLVVGAVILFAVEALDKRLRSAKRAERSFGYPVVAEIPDSSSPSAEAYRMLRLSLLHEPFPDVDTGSGQEQLAGSDDGDLWAGVLSGPTRTLAPPTSARRSAGSPRQIVLVASPGSEPTRPFVAANLAAACAEAGQRVVVISTVDVTGSAFDNPLVAGPIVPGDVEAHLETSSVERVQRLSLEPFVSNPGQVVTRAPAVLDALRSLVDVVIVEVPPFLSVHHGEGLTRAVDVVLAVAEMNVTTSDDGARMGHLLRRLDAPVLGVVLTNVHVKDDRPALRELDEDDTEAADDEVGSAAGATTGSGTVPAMGLPPGFGAPPGSPTGP